MINKLKKIPQFLREVKEEIKKVNWSSRQELKEITVLVIIASFALTAYLALVDAAFGKIVQELFKQ